MSRLSKPKLRLAENFCSQCLCPPEGLSLNISTLGGPLCTVLCDCRSTIADVKTLIAKSTNIPVQEQHLLLRCRELGDSEALQSCLQGFSSLVLLRRDPEQALWIDAMSMGEDLATAPEHLRNDKEVVLAAVKWHPLQLAHASEDLRDDEHLATLAVSSSGGSAFQFCSERLRGERDLLNLALNPGLNPHACCPEALRYASDELRNDKALIVQAVQRNRFVVNEAPPHLQLDRDVILAACRSKFHWSDAALGDCQCCGGIPLPSYLLGDRDFIRSAVDLGQVYFLQYAFGQHPELYEDNDLVWHLLTSMLLLGDGAEVGWLRSSMKSFWHDRITHQFAEDNMHDKIALECSYRRRKHCKRACRAQQKARVRQVGSRKLSYRGGRHKRADAEDWIL